MTFKKEIIGEYYILDRKYFYWKMQKGKETIFYNLFKEGEEPTDKAGGYKDINYLIGVKKNIKIYNSKEKGLIKTTFDHMPYGTKTTTEAMQEIKKLLNSLKDYSLEITNRQHEENFFIFKHNKKRKYIRICLIPKGFHSESVFYWSVDFNFKPFSPKKYDKWESQAFKGKAEDLYLSYLVEGIKQIRRYLKDE